MTLRERCEKVAVKTCPNRVHVEGWQGESSKSCTWCKPAADHIEALCVEVRREAVKEFYDLVCQRAEEKMIKTGKLEGAHFASMKEIISCLEEVWPKPSGD